MPSRKRLKRREVPAAARFLTFSRNHRLPLLGNAAILDLFAKTLTAAREQCGFRLIAWVVMPEHVHLLIVPDMALAPVPVALAAIKQPVAQRVIARWREIGAPVLDRIKSSNGRFRYWQPGGGFDRTVRDAAELNREIAYIHENPVKRGLVTQPTEWAWSSARWYAGEREGQVPVDVERSPKGLGWMPAGWAELRLKARGL